MLFAEVGDKAVPGLVEQLASEDKGPRYVGRRLALTGIGVEAFLHRLPEAGRNDPLMLSRVYLALVGDLTGVDRVVQHLIKVAARERQPAAESAAILMALGDQPEVIGFLFEKVDAVAERRGEADDGPALSALRRFRDGYMTRTAERKAMVAEYYATAPRIVSAIPSWHPDWDWIGARIDAAVAAIAASDDDEAFRIYAAMMRRLEARWPADVGQRRHHSMVASNWLIPGFSGGIRENSWERRRAFRRFSIDFTHSSLWADLHHQTISSKSAFFVCSRAWTAAVPTVP